MTSNVNSGLVTMGLGLGLTVVLEGIQSIK